MQGWTSLGFSGPADVRFTDWPDKNRTPPPRPPDVVRLARRQGVVRRSELVQPPRPRLRVVARGRLLERLRARAGDHGRLPGRPQGSRHRQPRRQGGADPRRSSTGSRSPTSTASASTPSSTSIAPRSTRNVRGFWGDVHRPHAREGEGARQAELLHLRRRRSTATTI